MDYTEDKIKRIIQILLGVCCCAGAYKFFLAPAGLYNGGFTGIAQIIRNLLQEVGGFTFRSDPTGILVWCLNIPLMIIGYKVLGRMFMLKTIAVISMQSMLMTVIKGPEAQLISDHALNCVCGGALSGFGIGMLLRSGASGGGTDIVGMVAAKKKPGVSVGSISMSIKRKNREFRSVRFQCRSMSLFSLMRPLPAALRSPPTPRYIRSSHP